MSEYKVVALYKFVSLPDYKELQEPILHFCKERDIKGSLLLAEEGINGTVAGRPEAIDELVDYLERGNQFKGRFKNTEIKFSISGILKLLASSANICTGRYFSFFFGKTIKN